MRAAWFLSAVCVCAAPGGAEGVERDGVELLGDGGTESITDSGALSGDADGGAVPYESLVVLHTEEIDGGVVDGGSCAGLGRAVLLESIDEDGAKVGALVHLDGVLVGRAPISLSLTSCDHQLSISSSVTGEERKFDVSSAPDHLVVNWDGMRRYWSASAFGDLMVFPSPLTTVPPGHVFAAGVLGAGIRFDRWGKYLHGSIAITVNPLFAPYLYFLGMQLPVLPGIDLFLGYNNRSLGNERVRAIISVQVGLWSLVVPAVRATVGALIVGRLVFTLSFDARVMLPRYAVSMIFNSLPGPISFGMTGGVGVAW